MAPHGTPLEVKLRLPDFICVGAQKSGTTWLYKQLLSHPQVFMPAKELDYFYGSKDLIWYGQQFEGAGVGQRCGDISPNYAAFIGVSEQIHATCPDAVILHLLRDPVSRAYSQWRMARYLGNIPLEMCFIEAFRSNSQFMKRRGEYAIILREYDRFFPLGQASEVFWYDEIRDRPDQLIKAVLAFVGVEPNWRSPYLNEVVWPSPDPGFIEADDAREVRRYYEPFDEELRTLLRVGRLPWDGREYVGRVDE
jgi:hypothetical protein